jgi:hypothetical protein
MAPRKPGRVFWLLTFAIGVISPGRGKRRINRRMQEIYQAYKSSQEHNLSLTSDVKFLRGELRRLQGENNTFYLQDDINEVMRNMPTSHSFGSDDTETTMPLRTVNKPMAKAS